MEIVQACIDDAPAILELQKTAYRSEAEIYQDHNIEPLTQTIEEVREQFKTHVFLKALVDGRIVGSVRAYEKNGTCYVGKLAVSSVMRNKGIGTALMNAIESRFVSKRFELFTGSKSVKNIYLYKKLGYAICKKEARGCGGIEILYMEKFRKR